MILKKSSVFCACPIVSVHGWQNETIYFARPTYTYKQTHTSPNIIRLWLKSYGSRVFYEIFTNEKTPWCDVIIQSGHIGSYRAGARATRFQFNLRHANPMINRPRPRSVSKSLGNIAQQQPLPPADERSPPPFSNVPVRCTAVRWSPRRVYTGRGGE